MQGGRKGIFSNKLMFIKTSAHGVLMSSGTSGRYEGRV